MRSAWAGGLHLRSRAAEQRGAGNDINTCRQSAHSSTTDTNACGMLLPALALRKPGVRLEAFLVSAGVVALAEIGDKTQLLALVLGARFRAPLPVILGILTATLANHFAAGALGTLLAVYISPALLRYLLAASFLATALWLLIPDKPDPAAERARGFGAYGTSALSFFLLEFGDKTQIATLALAARYHLLLAVVAGTTLGMMLADVPAVLLANATAMRLPFKLIHRLAAVAFLVLALLALRAGVG